MEKDLHAPSIRRRCTWIARPEAHYTCTSQHSGATALMTLLDHQRAQERTEAAEAHQKDEKHGLLITKKDANAKPPCPPTKRLRSQAFILDQMRHSMKFFSPERAIDESGGYFHFFAADGSIFDADTKVLVTQARFIFSLSVAAEHLKDPKYLKAVGHGVSWLATGPLRNKANGAYHWALKDGRPTSSKIFTYGLAQCLLAYAAALRAGCKTAAPYLHETWETLETRLFVEKDGLYAEEASSDWKVDKYRSESGNLHMTEALIACYEATSDEKFLERALLVADRICNRAAGQTQGLVWDCVEINQ